MTTINTRTAVITLKINWTHVAHDVVVFGGVVEAVLSVAGVLGPSLPAADVAILSSISAGVGFVVALAEDIAAGKDPTSSLGRLISFIVGFFARGTPQPPALNPSNTAATRSGRVGKSG